LRVSSIMSFLLFVPSQISVNRVSVYSSNLSADVRGSTRGEGTYESTQVGLGE
jgi:hypothetical protein